MRIRYLVITAVLATAIFGFANIAKASCIDENFSQRTTAEKIQCLTSIIADLNQQLTQLQSQQGGGTTWCHTFNANIGVGVKKGNPELDALVIALQKEGLLEQGATFPEGYDETLASAVTAFQEKYASEILTPYNLAHGTGYVGTKTRAKLNQLYGCGTKQECKIDADCPTINCLVAPCPVNKCVNEKCVSTTTPNTCTKSDNKNYYVKGDLKSILNDGSSYNKTDYCYGNYIFEWYCDGVNPRVDQSYLCPNGCENGACKPSTQPSITVTSPNGGEILTTGQIYTIKWNSFGIPNSQNVKIELAYTHNDLTYVAGNRFEDWIVEKTPNTGSYAWTVSEFYGLGLNASSFSVKITSESGAIDYSDANFTIKMGTSNPALTIAPGPIAGATYKAGDQITISWAPFDGMSSYGLTLLKKSDPSFIRWATLYPVYNSTASGVPQSYYWNVLPVLSGNDYYLRVDTSKTASRTNIGYSAVFTITDTSTQPSITVLSPNGGGLINLGQNMNIVWESSGILQSDKINIWLEDYTDPSNINSSMVVVNLAGNLGEYNWVIPYGVKVGEKYKIKIETFRNNSFLGSDESNDYFRIVSASCIPTWQCGAWSVCTNNQQTRTCTDSNSCNNTTTKPSESQLCSNTTSCTDTDNGKDYYTKGIVTSKYGTYTDLCYPAISKIFEYYCDSTLGYSQGEWYTCPNGCENGACKQTTTASITVTSPNGGEAWKVGETRDITWTSSGIDNVAIGIFSYDSAGTRTNPGTIYGGAPAANGRYSWTIPSDYATFVNKERVKIYLLGYGANVPISTSTIYDFSDNYFSIAAPTTALNISENQLASISEAIAKIFQELELLKK